MRGQRGYGILRERKREEGGGCLIRWRGYSRRRKRIKGIYC